MKEERKEKKRLQEIKEESRKERMNINDNFITFNNNENRNGAK